MTNYYLSERWGISRGAETYGYNVCTIETTKIGYADYVPARGQCKGGGYDMAGTSLADCLCAIPLIQEKLKARFDSVDAETIKNTHYSLFRRSDGSYAIDGGCGQETVKARMDEAGVTVSPNYRKKGRNMERIGWFVTVSE
jgi:hypothetical protein